MTTIPLHPFAARARAELAAAPVSDAEAERVRAALAEATGPGAAYDLWVALCSVTSAHARLAKLLDTLTVSQPTFWGGNGAA